jgi:hypothetical protein
MTNTLPTPAELAEIESEELDALAVAWRTRALHGDKGANGIAHALEVEQRRRTRASQLQQLPVQPAAGPRPWWRFWQDRTDSRGGEDDPMSPT